MWNELVPGVNILSGREAVHTFDRVSGALGTGEILRCVYFGGESAPGEERPIVPLSIEGKYVWARCLNSGKRKRYLIERMRILDEGQRAPDVGPPDGVEVQPAPQRAVLRSLQDVVDRHGAEIEGLGWHLLQSDEALTIHLLDGDRIAAEIGLGFDVKREEWLVARKGKRRIYRATLKGAATQFLEHAAKEARAVDVARRAEPAQRHWGWVKLPLALIAAFLVGIAIGLMA